MVEWGTWIQRIFLGGDYDMTIIGHSEPRDINVYGNPDYYYGYDNERVRELLAEIEATADIDEQTQLYEEIATIIAEDAVNVWVFNPDSLIAARNDLYGFWESQPTPSIDMTEVFLGQVDRRRRTAQDIGVRLPNPHLSCCSMSFAAF